MTDRDLILARLVVLAGPSAPERSVSFVHPGVPVPWERPRFNRTTGAVFTAVRTRNAEQALAWTFAGAMRGRSPFTDNVALVAQFYVPDRQPKDLDNCLKLVMDAGNHAGIWRDDRTVRALCAWIDIDAAAPRTVIAIAPCLSSEGATA